MGQLVDTADPGGTREETRRMATVALSFFFFFILLSTLLDRRGGGSRLFDIQAALPSVSSPAIDDGTQRRLRPFSLWTGNPRRRRRRRFLLCNSFFFLLFQNLPAAPLDGSARHFVFESDRRINESEITDNFFSFQFVTEVKFSMDNYGVEDHASRAKNLKNAIDS